jgi:hypothetical protein
VVKKRQIDEIDGATFMEEDFTDLDEPLVTPDPDFHPDPEYGTGPQLDAIAYRTEGVKRACSHPLDERRFFLGSPPMHPGWEGRLAYQEWVLRDKKVAEMGLFQKCQRCYTDQFLTLLTQQQEADIEKAIEKGLHSADDVLRVLATQDESRTAHR